MAIDQMACAQNIPREIFEQGHVIYFTLTQQPGWDAQDTDDTIEAAAKLLADYHGYTQPGARYYFEIEIMASIRARLRHGGTLGSYTRNAHGSVGGEGE